jgi:hypothetical protein
VYTCQIEAAVRSSSLGKRTTRREPQASTLVASRGILTS